MTLISVNRPILMAESIINSKEAKEYVAAGCCFLICCPCMTILLFKSKCFSSIAEKADKHIDSLASKRIHITLKENRVADADIKKMNESQKELKILEQISVVRQIAADYKNFKSKAYKDTAEFMKYADLINNELDVLIRNDPKFSRKSTEHLFGKSISKTESTKKEEEEEVLV